MPSMGAGAAGKGRPVLPFAVNPLCLDVSAPASRLEHPLLAPPRSVIPRLRGSSPGGPSSPAAPPSVAGLAPRRSVPQVFDLSALPCESPRTPRALVTPLHVRRRHPLQAPPWEGTLPARPSPTRRRRPRRPGSPSLRLPTSSRLRRRRHPTHTRCVSTGSSLRCVRLSARVPCSRRAGRRRAEAPPCWRTMACVPLASLPSDRPRRLDSSGRGLPEPRARARAQHVIILARGRAPTVGGGPTRVPRLCAGRGAGVTERW
jgi:hypothetical protein